METHPDPKKRKLISLSIYIVLGFSFFLRLYNLEDYPLAINQDELSNIYDGYSIAETGADRWGSRYPTILRAFGDADYRPPMYAWISALSVKLFGFSVISGRLPAAIIGCLSLILLYSLCKKAGGSLFALITVFLAGLSPWHILYSRMALEAASLTAFFALLIFWLWFKMRETGYKLLYVALVGLTIGLATSTYQSFKLISLILAAALGIEILKNSRSKMAGAFLFVLATFAGSFPQIYTAYTQPEHFFSRASNTMIPFEFSVSYFTSILTNFFSNFSPHYLFLSFGESNNLSIGRALAIELPFFYLGLFVFPVLLVNKERTFNPWFVYFLVFVVLFPGSLTTDNPSAIRSSPAGLLFPMFSAAGFVFIYHKLKIKTYRVIFLICFVILGVLNLLFNLNSYAGNIGLRNYGFQNHLVEMSKRIDKLKGGYDAIYIEDKGNQPYIYIAAFCGITPQRFQTCDKRIENWGWDHFVKLDKYRFLSKEIIETIPVPKDRKELLVVTTRMNGKKIVDSLETCNTPYYFYEN